jgi:predicted MPP superfamily phosphohydrolase
MLPPRTAATCWVAAKSGAKCAPKAAPQGLLDHRTIPTRQSGNTLAHEIIKLPQPRPTLRSASSNLQPFCERFERLGLAARLVEPPMSVINVDTPTDDGEEETVGALERRLGQLYARQRLGIEKDHEAQKFGQGLNFFHIENWHSSPWLIRNSLRLMGLYRRAQRNAERLVVKHNPLWCSRLPLSFDDFAVLHISDMHVDLNEGAMRCLCDLVEGLDYDLCVLTGDYRGKTFGPFEATLDGMARVRAKLRGPVYGVLGNHDTIRMVPGLGIRMLLNECDVIERSGERIYLAGIDDAHFYRVDNIEKAGAAIPSDEFSILLSHTPEIHRQAAHAGFNLMLSGHTHGGQLCLPGSIPITLDSVLPRRMGSGSWRYGNMLGYTSAGAGSSIVSVRLNCPPEITVHHLRSA